MDPGALYKESNMAMAQHLSVPHTSWIKETKKTIISIVFNGHKYRVEQIAYEADDFIVYELANGVELEGKEEKYLAVTEAAQLFSIDVYAAPRDFLTTHHGQAWIEIA